MQKDDKKPTVAQLLAELQASVLAGSRPSGKVSFGPTDFFFMRDGMSITLRDEDIDRYHGLVDGLSREVPKANRPLVSARTIEAIAQSAIVAVAKGTKDVETIKAALGSARKKLLAPPATWELWFAVVHMTAPRRRRRFGRLTFQAASPRAIRVLTDRGNAILNQTTNTPDEKAISRRRFTNEINKALEGKVIAAVNVTAIDKQSAERLAIDQIRETLDIIGFFGSLVEPLAALPSIDHGGEWPAAPVLTIETDRSASWLAFARPRRPALKLDRLFERKPSKDLLVLKVSKLLRNDRPSASEERILTAMRWAGRAAGRPRPSEQFLYYLIALETLLLPVEADSELTYRFKLRAAHVLGRSLEWRQKIFKRVGELYEIRSKMVHAGSHDVSAEDLSTARQFTVLAIWQMLKRLGRHRALDQWFVRQALR